MLAGSIPTKVGRPKKDRVEGQGLDPLSAGRVQRRQDGPGAAGLGLDPVPQGRMVGDFVSGQEHAEEVLDRPQAQPHGEGDGRQFLLLVLVEDDAGPGGRGHRRRGDDRGPRSIFRGLGRRLVAEPLLELVGVLGDGLTAAAGLLGWAGDGAVPTGEDGGGVEDPGANG
jgi:hypothetical protein